MRREVSYEDVPSDFVACFRKRIKIRFFLKEDHLLKPIPKETEGKKSLHLVNANENVSGALLGCGIVKYQRNGSRDLSRDIPRGDSDHFIFGEEVMIVDLERDLLPLTRYSGEADGVIPSGSQRSLTIRRLPQWVSPKDDHNIWIRFSIKIGTPSKFSTDYGEFKVDLDVWIKRGGCGDSTLGLVFLRFLPSSLRFRFILPFRTDDPFCSFIRIGRQ